ncbi:hypothetical protein SAMN02745120_0139 [Acetoanaerobium noterae]|uniref:Uncharacterized protein n=1 Tax=Acetoanaerobium noterae TaxID=745369 RepID=A0A1T5DU38_9FIRM|nr:hypothetical protein SAMN02745120_0139 [Acetoanaerobium noterae]
MDSLNLLLKDFIFAGAILLSLIYVLKIMSNHGSTNYYIKRIIGLILINGVAYNIEYLINYFKSHF